MEHCRRAAAALGLQQRGAKQMLGAHRSLFCLSCTKNCAPGGCLQALGLLPAFGCHVHLALYYIAQHGNRAASHFCAAGSCQLQPGQTQGQEMDGTAEQPTPLLSSTYCVLNQCHSQTPLIGCHSQSLVWEHVCAFQGDKPQITDVQFWGLLH